DFTHTPPRPAWSSRPKRKSVRFCRRSIASRTFPEAFMKKILLAAASVAALSLSSSQPIVAQDTTNQQLGNVHFETSCNEVAQRRFDRAMRYQHSFWYNTAGELFEEAAKADAECGIAYWGLALSLLANPHSPIPQPNLKPGLAAIQKAKQVGAKTERERDY